MFMKTSPHDPLDNFKLYRPILVTTPRILKRCPEDYFTEKLKHVDKEIKYRESASYMNFLCCSLGTFSGIYIYIYTVYIYIYIYGGEG